MSDPVRGRKENRHAQSGSESGHVRHPRVWLRHNPLRSDVIGKGIAGDDELGVMIQVAPSRAAVLTAFSTSRRFFAMSPGIGAKMEQRDACAVCQHSLRDQDEGC